jgi:hypothetical protein
MAGFGSTKTPMAKPSEPGGRRTAVPFDPYLFERLAAGGRTHTLEDTFRRIYENNHWGAEQRSGAGASRGQTAVVLSELAALLRELHINVLLDVPCGDFSWMQHLAAQEVSYIGGDIVPGVIAMNNVRFASSSRTFQVLDLTRDALPAADLLLCRDCLVHLSFADALAALANVAHAPIRYFLTSTFPDCSHNDDIVSGDWRVINLSLPPFNLPPPLRLIGEQCSEANGLFSDKSLALYRVEDLPR